MNPLVLPSKPMPLLGVQTWPSHGNETMKSRVWKLPFVIPYISTFFSYGDGDIRLMPQRAAQSAADIASIRDSMKTAHPNVNFRWGWWPHRYGLDGIKGPHDRLFYSRADAVTGVSPAGGWISGPWTRNGVEAYRAATEEFLDCFVRELLRRGLPLWEFVDPDYEAGAPLWVNTFADTRRPDNTPMTFVVHNMLLFDARARTELIDGTVTYAQWAEGLKDLLGDRIPQNQLFPWIYDSSQWARAFIFSNLSQRIVDAGLNRALYSLCRERNPRGLCGNWLSHGASREHLVHGYRFKESPVDFGATFKGDVMIPATYGSPAMDLLSQPVGVGYNTHNEQLRRFGVDPKGYSNKDKVFEDLHVANIDYFLQGCRDANPKVGRAFSITWRGDGIWTGKDVIPADDRYYPAAFQGAVLDYNRPTTAKRIFDVFKRHSCRFVEIFAQDATVHGLDRMADTLQSVQFGTKPKGGEG